MAAPEDTRVLLDVMVGGLTSILRMCGYDTAYALERGAEADEAVIDIARQEGRTILTRDRQIVDRYDDSILLTSTDTDEQLQELSAAGFTLRLAEPGRCSRCNGELVLVRDGKPPDEGPDPDTEPVWRCQSCGHHFWKGSHWADVETRVTNI